MLDDPSKLKYKLKRSEESTGSKIINNIMLKNKYNLLNDSNEKIGSVERKYHNFFVNIVVTFDREDLHENLDIVVMMMYLYDNDE